MTLTQTIAGFDASLPVERARTPPAEWYQRSDVLALERKAILGAHWQVAARADQLSEPGSYVAGQIDQDTFVVVRDQDGILRAFANVCRHNGTALAHGCGRTDILTCPYHGWRYDLDGRLRTAPRTAGLADFNRADFGLIALGVWQFGPMILVHPAGPRPAPNLATLNDRLHATGWSDLQFHSERSYDLTCNWKVFVDNYLDGGYHVGMVHPTLAKELNEDAYKTEMFADYSIQSAPAANDATSRLAGEAIYAWVYPNLMINRYGPMLDINVVHPTGPTTCRVDFIWYFDASCAADFIEESLHASDQVQQEDIAICHEVQRGMASRHFQPGPYAPRVEMSKHQFHQSLARDLDAADDTIIVGR